MTDHPDPTALRLEGQRLVEAIDAATTMIEEGVRGMAKSDCDGGGFLERSDAREIAREVLTTAYPTLLQSLAALTEERDRLRELSEELRAALTEASQPPGLHADEVAWAIAESADCALREIDAKFPATLTARPTP